MRLKCGLLIIDVQIDFCPGGALPVPRGHEIVPTLNKYIDLFSVEKYPVFASRDWHPRNSRHFEAMGGQWPSHCIQDTQGARFHPMLHLPDDVIIVSAGTQPDENGYSVYDGKTEEGEAFNNILDQLGIEALFIGGLATDYCVKQSVLDLLNSGFNVYLLVDAVKGLDVSSGDSDNAIEEMSAKGAQLVRYDRVEEMLLLHKR